MAARKPAPTQPARTKPAALPAIRVTSRREGFRRGGRAWSVRPVTILIDEFTIEQLDQIRAEPMLSVEFCELAQD